ncbi:meiosis-specific transcription factor ndt80 [Geranomyces michiganensis]|nr:meiosis-specific transcription factor ndt80 [Geranomyces michiganensis]
MAAADQSGLRPPPSPPIRKEHLHHAGPVSGGGPSSAAPGGGSHFSPTSHYQQLPLPNVQHNQRPAYSSDSAAAAAAAPNTTYHIGAYPPIKTDPLAAHHFNPPSAQEDDEEQSPDGYMPPSGPPIYSAPRKLSIDTSITKSIYDPSYEPTSPGYYALPPMDSPGRRRRPESMEPYSINVGPFFKPTKQIFNIYSIDRARLFQLRVNPKVDRGFFLADSDWTCYRRNYFQVSASFSACDPHGQEVELPCLMEMENNLYTVTGFLIGISARVGNGEKTIDLIQHTPKRDKGPQLVPQPRPVRAGGNPHQYNGIGTNNLVATFERLQFKTATANNGKRRAAQQYYVLNLDLYAQLDNGQKFKVGFIESAPLVVRGRSPGHYADGNLDPLRGFPLDAYGRRPEYFSPQMPMYASSPVYSPGTPGSAMVSPPTSLVPMSGPYSSSGNPHHHNHLAALSAPAAEITSYPQMHSYPPNHGHRSGAEPLDPMHPIWQRTRADSLAHSDCSYATSGTALTTSSYNSPEFETGVMGPSTRHNSISPVTPPGTARPSPLSGHGHITTVSPPNRLAPHSQHHHQHSAPPPPQSHGYHYGASPKQANHHYQQQPQLPLPHIQQRAYGGSPYAPQYASSVPGWIDNEVHTPGGPHSAPVHSPLTPGSDLSHLMVGFGFRGQNSKNAMSMDDARHHQSREHGN